MKLGVLQDKIDHCIKEQGGDLFDDKHFYVSIQRTSVDDNEFNSIRFYNSHYQREFFRHFNINRWISAAFVHQIFIEFVKSEIDYEINKIINEISNMYDLFTEFIPKINYYKDINKNKFKLELIRDRDYAIIYNSVSDQIEIYSYIVAGDISIIPIAEFTPSYMIEDTIEIIKTEYDKYLKQLLEKYKEEF